MITDVFRYVELTRELDGEITKERKVELLKEIITVLESMKPLEDTMHDLTGAKVSTELNKMKTQLKELESEGVK